MKTNNMLIMGFLLFIFGIGFISFSLTIIVESKDVGRTIAGKLRIHLPIALMMFAGVCSIFAMLTNLFSALLKRDFLIGMSVMIIAVTSIIGMNCAGFSGIYLMNANESIYNSLETQLSQYNQTNRSVMTPFNELDSVQIKFQCCGVISFNEWNQTNYFKVNAKYPESCYTTSKGEHVLNKGGCLEPVYEVYRTIFIEMILIAGSVSVILEFGTLKIRKVM